ncbi:hypothetical protein TcasGA2_TC014002 [Tribolium castaneum]|uniref:Uncharacterized protein n=1 Tax=Tribolium castaneum TaxID=7070 RepID=D6WJ49_TRICA|nr:hypothetical protein TcasGA2_TC014002 [Tribolium castaneum]
MASFPALIRMTPAGAECEIESIIPRKPSLNLSSEPQKIAAGLQMSALAMKWGAGRGAVGALAAAKDARCVRVRPQLTPFLLSGKSIWTRSQQQAGFAAGNTVHAPAGGAHATVFFLARKLEIFLQLTSSWPNFRKKTEINWCRFKCTRVFGNRCNKMGSPEVISTSLR